MGNANVMVGKGVNGGLRAILLLAILSIIWGTSFLLMKRGLVVYSPGEVASIRVVTGALFLLPFALVRRRNVARRHLPKLFASGVLGVFIPAFFLALAQTRLASSMTGMINSLTPVCTLLVGVAAFKQELKWHAIAGVLIALAGVTVLILSSNMVKGMFTFDAFALCVIVACLSYGANLNLVKYKLSEVDALTVTSISLTLVAPLAVAYLFNGTDAWAKLMTAEGGKTAILYVILLGILSTSIATVLFNYLVMISTPIFASSVTYFITIVAVMWGMMDGEAVFAGQVFGMSVTVGGVYLANKVRT